MNQLVTIDIATLTPATVFAPGGVEAIVSKIEAEVSAEVFTLDTAEGRERIKSVAYKVARSKTALDDMGKELVSGIKAQAATIDAERRIIRERLDALKDRVRGPLTDWETIEANRIAAHEGCLVWLAQCDRFATSPTVNMIRAQIGDAAEIAARNWEEFKERADAAIGDAMPKLDAMLTAAIQAERDAAELATLRQQAAERAEADRIAAEKKAKAEREAHERAAAAERARVYAEQEADRERQRTEKAQRDQEAAAARAIERERERVARAKADEERATAKREANKKHRAKIEGTAVESLALHIPREHAEKAVAAIAALAILHVNITY